MGSPIDAEFQRDPQTVFDAARRAVVKCGYKLDSADPQSGIVSFKTGMSLWSWAGQEMSLLITANGAKTLVCASGRRNQGAIPQVYDWGEASGIARKVLSAIDQELARIPTPPIPGHRAAARDDEPGVFKVIGIDRETQLDCSWVIPAETMGNARAKGELKGMLVTEVRRLPPDA